MTASSEFPQIFRVRQKFDSTRLDDVPGEVLKQLAALKLVEKVRPGQSVAITAGSRGIANIATITRTIVEHFISLGAKPFIVPAMGSHGGATAEGQRQVIESYGISESFVGCPIRSSMETVVLGHDIKGFPLHFDSLAYRADHIVVCNRIKPHTDFQGDIESGLMKMLLIGLGKREGARIYHRAMLDYGYDHVLQKTSERVLDACPVLAGVAAVENALDETAAIAAYKPSDFASREKELLVLARK
ncbi:MAG: lactate racemase domain-containing protein, partial [Thermoguttaceae bacterium]